jgi:hypothetical protein
MLRFSKNQKSLQSNIFGRRMINLAYSIPRLTLCCCLTVVSFIYVMTNRQVSLADLKLIRDTIQSSKQTPALPFHLSRLFYCKGFLIKIHQKTWLKCLFSEVCSPLRPNYFEAAALTSIIRPWKDCSTNLQNSCRKGPLRNLRNP